MSTTLLRPDKSGSKQWQLLERDIGQDEYKPRKKVDKTEHVCPDCGIACRSAAGLASHRRASHRRKKGKLSPSESTTTQSEPKEKPQPKIPQETAVGVADSSQSTSLSSVSTSTISSETVAHSTKPPDTTTTTAAAAAAATNPGTVCPECGVVKVKRLRHRKFCSRANTQSRTVTPKLLLLAGKHCTRNEECIRPLGHPEGCYKCRQATGTVGDKVPFLINVANSDLAGKFPLRTGVLFLQTVLDMKEVIPLQLSPPTTPFSSLFASSALERAGGYSVAEILGLVLPLAVFQRHKMPLQRLAANRLYVGLWFKHTARTRTQPVNRWECFFVYAEHNGRKQFSWHGPEKSGVETIYADAARSTSTSTKGGEFSFTTDGNFVGTFVGMPNDFRVFSVALGAQRHAAALNILAHEHPLILQLPSLKQGKVSTLVGANRISTFLYAATARMMWSSSSHPSDHVVKSSKDHVIIATFAKRLTVWIGAVIRTIDSSEPCQFDELCKKRATGVELLRYMDASTLATLVATQLCVAQVQLLVQLPNLKSPSLDRSAAVDSLAQNIVNATIRQSHTLLRRYSDLKKKSKSFDNMVSTFASKKRRRISSLPTTPARIIAVAGICAGLAALRPSHRIKRITDFKRHGDKMVWNGIEYSKHGPPRSTEGLPMSNLPKGQSLRVPRRHAVVKVEAAAVGAPDPKKFAPMQWIDDGSKSAALGQQYKTRESQQLGLVKRSMNTMLTHAQVSRATYLCSAVHVTNGTILTVYFFIFLCNGYGFHLACRSITT